MQEANNISTELNKIKKQINDKLKGNQELLKLLTDLKENRELIESILDTSKDDEQLSHLADTGKEIYEELEQKIKLQNRNIAALLGADFRKIRAHYLSFLPKEKENPTATLNINPSQSMSHFNAGRDIQASQTYNDRRSHLNTFNQSAVTLGDNSQAILMMPYHPPSEKLPEMWNVPPKNNYFTGRDELLKQMTNYFDAKESKHLVLAARGLGGIGKTQLTLEYVWRNYQHYKGVCWFNAEDKERLITSYINLGQELHLFDDSDKNILIDEKAKIVKTWLENKAPNGWLLIFDNPIKYEDIAQFLPVKGGHILITSRYTEWPGQCFKIEVFTLQEAREYAEKIIGIEKVKTEAESLNKLIDTLGRLPLALAQAFAYIKKNNKTINQYLSLYETSRAELLAKNLLPAGDKHECVAVTWNITLQKIKEESAESVELMYCCTYLHHQDIPVALTKYLFKNIDELTVDDAVRIAKEYSMINIDEKKQIFSLHSLVQQVIYDQLIKKGEDVDYLLRGIKALKQLYPYDKDQTVDFALKRVLKPHLEQSLEYLDKHLKKLSLLNDEKTIKVVFELQKDTLLWIIIHLADANNVLGNAKEQKVLLEHALKIQEAHYGTNHVDVAITLNNLANAYGALGNAKEQKILLERALKIKEAHYGKEHVELAKTLNNLATAYGVLGDAKEQKILLERTLKIQEAHYGTNHVEVAITLNNLANAYGALGNAKEQKILLERALKIEEAHYGKGHVIVAKTLGNLANAYGALGDAKEQKLLLERALKIIEAHYGTNHVDVAITLNNLATAYGDLGDAKEQKVLLERALKIEEAHYDKDHVKVARTLNNLANAYGDLGNAKEEKALLEKALKIQEAYYGKEHVAVAITLMNLGNAYGALGDAKEEKALLEKALKIQEAIYYGKEHSEVAVTLFNLSLCYLNQKNLIEAKNYMQQAYNIFIKSPNCGIKHPNTKKAKQELDEIIQKLSISQEKEIISSDFSKKPFVEETKQNQAFNKTNKLAQNHVNRYSMWCRGSTAIAVGVVGTAALMAIAMPKETAETIKNICPIQ